MNVSPTSSADLFRTGAQGLQRAEAQANKAAQKLADGELEAKHIIDLKTAEAAHKANAAVLGVADRMHDDLLDILV
jgi:hypothetical protein